MSERRMSKLLGVLALASVATLAACLWILKRKVGPFNIWNLSNEKDHTFSRKRMMIKMMRLRQLYLKVL